jgi:hypothetical protein
VTSYVIPEACVNITYSIVSAKRDAFRDTSSICKTRVTSVTVIDSPYLSQAAHVAVGGLLEPACPLQPEPIATEGVFRASLSVWRGGYRR